MQLNELLTHFYGVKQLSGSGHYAALCPCHSDHKPSLDICEKDGKILMTCPVCGADGRAVMQAVGLNVRELFYEQRQSKQEKPQSVDYLYSDTLKKTRYYTWNATKNQYDKAFCWYHMANGAWTKGKGSEQPPLYKQKNIRWAIDHGKTLYIAEGEKDVDTLTKRLHLPAVCSPHGAGQGKLESKWRADYNALFAGADVAILADNDEAGKALAQHIAAQLLPFAKSVRLPDLAFEWENLKPKGDITDIYEAQTPLPNKTLAETVRFKLGVLTDTTAALTAPKQPSKYTRLSDVESTVTQWLWYPYIPLGKITLMTADPGTGKTFLALYLAAQVSAGRPFFGESAYREPAVAVYQTAEDGIADTIKPRLEPMRPNFDNIYVFNEEKESLSLSSEHVEEIMQDLHPKLLIFDPLQAYLGADVDMHRANEVRPVLGRIGHLAEKYGCAVVFIMHNSKSSQNKALYRSLGSIDIPAVARSMLLLCNDPDNPGGKIMCHEKSSLAAHGKGVLFEIAPQGGGIVFSGFSDKTADDLLNLRTVSRTKPSAKLSAVCDDILDMFGESSRLEFGSIKELCDHLECSRNTLYRARDELQIQSSKIGFGKDNKIVWTLPEADIDTTAMRPIAP